MLRRGDGGNFNTWYGIIRRGCLNPLKLPEPRIQARFVSSSREYNPRLKWVGWALEALTFIFGTLPKDGFNIRGASRPRRVFEESRSFNNNARPAQHLRSSRSTTDSKYHQSVPGKPVHLAIAVPQSAYNITITKMLSFLNRSSPTCEDEDYQDA